ncbi:uncharacterized protein LOC110455464 isoform X2 [Mizuhopecten yessoensis]|uniref:MARVEL domain-containing protein n=1 Tax=Mizuhopecten yessoensis TaxID=6573 RepID=A0A210QCZ7_MIZYE|nr:uncharacterized protein LOC110455464 isoform X2 [Mizuhopecten yessoensis]OWF46633.1 hypothetical protein KP79_PYT10302 [Mizuhopecten yessoensis]
MAGWNTSSTWMKIALICLCLGLLLFVIAFATTGWMVYTAYGYDRANGLWEFKDCTGRGCVSGDVNPNRLMNDWYRATQAMECFGLICIVIATFLLLLYFFVASCKRRNALLATIVFTFASVGFIVIGIAIFASKFDNYGYEVGWSMGLAIAAAILAFVAGIMEVLEIK